MSFQLPEAIVDTLLDKLGSDDAFRAEFVANPRAALAGLGFAPAADTSISQGIWACMEVRELSSKEAIRAGRIELNRQLTRMALFTPFHLEAAQAIKAA
jgi:putative modified peptide